MWVNEYTAVTPLPADAIWQALRGLHEGTITYPGADRFDLHGPFAVGTEVSVTPQGQDTFQSRIVDLVDNRTYADQTSFGDVTLLFRHTLEPVDAGTRVTHCLQITGPPRTRWAPSSAHRSAATSLSRWPNSSSRPGLSPDRRAGQPRPRRSLLRWVAECGPGRAMRHLSSGVAVLLVEAAIVAPRRCADVFAPPR